MSVSLNQASILGKTFSFPMRVDALLQQQYSYTIKEEIASGGESTVYGAIRESPGGQQQHLGVKVLNRPDADTDNEDLFIMPQKAARKFIHNSLVRPIAIASIGYSCHIIMPRFDFSWESIRKLIRLVPKKSDRQKILADCGAALSLTLIDAYLYLLENGWCHGDIKHSNLFAHLREGNEALQLGDYGHMYRVNSERDVIKVGYVRGTPAFRAPEAEADRPFIVPQSDLWAVGKVIGDTIEDTDNYFPFTNAQTHNPQVAKSVKMFCDRCMSRDWNARPSVAELLAFRNEISQLVPSAQEPGVWICSKLRDLFLATVWKRVEPWSQLNNLCALSQHRDHAIHELISANLCLVAIIPPILQQREKNQKPVDIPNLEPQQLGFLRDPNNKEIFKQLLESTNEAAQELGVLRQKVGKNELDASIPEIEQLLAAFERGELPHFEESKKKEAETKEKLVTYRDEIFNKDRQVRNYAQYLLLTCLLLEKASHETARRDWARLVDKKVFHKETGVSRSSLSSADSRSNLPKMRHPVDESALMALYHKLRAPQH